jgi:hypothetical protein
VRQAFQELRGRQVQQESKELRDQRELLGHLVQAEQPVFKEHLALQEFQVQVELRVRLVCRVRLELLEQLEFLEPVVRQAQQAFRELQDQREFLEQVEHLVPLASVALLEFRERRDQRESPEQVALRGLLVSRELRVLLESLVHLALLELQVSV